MSCECNNRESPETQGDRANASPFAAEARELAWRRLPAIRQGFSELFSKRIQIQRLENQAIPSFNLPVLNDSNELGTESKRQNDVSKFSPAPPAKRRLERVGPGALGGRISN
jgi:hypothetical protein